LTAIAKAKAELARLEHQKVNARKALAKEHEECARGKAENEVLKKRLEAGIRDVLTELAAQKAKTDGIAVLEAALKIQVIHREKDVAAREEKVMERELQADLTLRKQIAVSRDQAEQQRNLTLLNAEYSLRVTALRLRENKVAAIIARERTLLENEARLDKKAKLVQDTGKEQAKARAEIARKRAILGRIKHKGVAK